MKIVDFRIVNGSKNRPLCEHVKYLLGKGWQPHGHIYLDRNGAEKQAMVKHEEPKQLPTHDEVLGRVAKLSPGAITPTKAKPKKKEVKNED